MCGIFGSSVYSTFEKSYIANQERGTFASGSLYVAPNDIYLRKNETGYDLTGEYAWEDVHKYQLYLGHAQAPTGSMREWSASTTHPFDVGDWIVAHNGVLENDKDLAKEYLYQHDHPVDSAVIPALLTEKHVGDDVFCIEEVAGLLKGTFACWLYNKKTQNTYLIRSGSTLYYTPDTNTFSSVPIDELCVESVEQGIVYQLTREGITQVGEFPYDSPFLIL